MVARVAMEAQKGGEIRAFFEYGRNNKKLASMRKQMVSMSWKGHKLHKYLVGAKILPVILYFDYGEIRNFLDMEILKFTWLPWQPGNATWSGYPLVFKTRPIMFWSMHNQSYVGRIALCTRKKLLKSGEIRHIYGNAVTI